ncbi:MAG: YicC family protein [Deltaproteobacteria bacterium]|nr:YicC family protein [Deltaproteobacteria bacterium]
MIRSMTGYGRAEGEVDGRKLIVEVKAVNHRFLNFLARLPVDLQRFEPEVLALVKAHLQRGQVSVFASWDSALGDAPVIGVNLAAARHAAEALRQAAAAVGVSGELSVRDLLAFPAVFAAGAPASAPEELWEKASGVFNLALVSLDELRRREAEDLAADMRQRLERIREYAASVEERRPRVVEEYRTRLVRRAEELASGLPIEVVRERLALEAAVFAERSDVQEELVRLRSHLDKFAELLDAGGAIGRKLDFLLQEMNRETNTIGSKAADVEVSPLVIEMKAELEKIREQVQNLE